jgi:CubicO group peptidase (beta-lactamase class C family)
MTPETTPNWFSSGKVISATLLSMLEHESKADLAKPVSCYLLQLK